MAELRSRQLIAWANKLKIDDLPRSYERNKLKNELKDSVWYVENDSDESFYMIQWRNYDIPEKWLFFVKQMLLNYCGNYVDKYQNITTNISSLKTFLGDSKRFFIEFHSQYKSKTLKELSIEELRTVLHSLILDEDKKLKSKMTVRGFGKIIYSIQGHFRNGKLSDGFLFDLPNNFIEYFYKDFVECAGEDYPVWDKGGSYEGVEVSLAIYILAYSLDTIRDHKTKAAVKYYEYLKKGLLTSKVLSSSHYSKGKYNSRLHNLSISYKSKYQPVAKRLIDEINEILPKEKINWFFESEKEINQYIQKIYDLSLIAIAILTGYRISELRFLLPSHLEKNECTGGYTIKTKIIKTNKGIGTIRSFSDVGAEIIELLCKLHKEDKVKKDIPVFSRVTRNSTKANNAVPYNTMLHCFKDGYRHFLNDQGLHFKETQDTLSPHNFRHTWVDMALRCFLPEKNNSILLEEIRQHLRHSYGSMWTRRYTDGKFTPVHMRELEEKYLNDLIKRIAGDDADEFVGPIAVSIKSKIKKRMVYIGMDEAVDEIINESSQGLLHLEGHPWGLCVLMEDTQTQAKCYDSESRTPRYEESSGFENCVGCIHRLSHVAMKEDVTKFVLAHEDFLDKFPVNSSRLRSISKEAVRVGRMAIQEMDREKRF